MILEHAPFGRRGFYASFTLQGVQAGQILAAAVFLPLAHYMPDRSIQQLGLADTLPAAASSSSLPATSFAAKSTRRRPSPKKDEHGEIPKPPIIQAFRLSWRDMLRVVCMALMNVIPVVATIFGAAYAVQPAYGIGFEKDVYLWIPVLGNILAVLVIPFVGNLSDKIGRKPPIIVGALGSGLLAFGYLYAISIQNVPLAIFMSLLMWGVVYQGYNADLPELLPRTVPDADPGLGDGHIRRISGQRSRPCFRHCLRPWRRPARPTSLSRRGNRLRHHRDRGDCGADRPGDLSDPHQRSRQSRRRSDGEGDYERMRARHSGQPSLPRAWLNGHEADEKRNVD